MNGRGIQTLIEAAFLILSEVINWAQNRSSGKGKQDHVPKS